MAVLKSKHAFFFTREEDETVGSVPVEQQVSNIEGGEETLTSSEPTTADEVIAAEEELLETKDQEVSESIDKVDTVIDTGQEIVELQQTNEKKLEEKPQEVTQADIIATERDMSYLIGKLHGLGLDIKPSKFIRVGLEAANAAPIQAFELQQEGIVDTIKEFFRKVWDFIKSIGAKIVEFFKMLFGGTKKKEQEIKEAKAKIADVNKKIDQLEKDVKAATQVRKEVFDKSLDNYLEMKKDIKEALEAKKNSNDRNTEVLDTFNKLASDSTLCGVMQFLYLAAKGTPSVKEIVEFGNSFSQKVVEISNSLQSGNNPSEIYNLGWNDNIDKNLANAVGISNQYKNIKFAGINSLDAREMKTLKFLVNDGDNTVAPKEIEAEIDYTQMPTYSEIIEKTLFSKSVMKEYIETAEKGEFSKGIEELEKFLSETLKRLENNLKKVESDKNVSPETLEQCKTLMSLFNVANRRCKLYIQILNKLPNIGLIYLSIVKYKY